jgi:hypothetical protein
MGAGTAIRGRLMGMALLAVLGSAVLGSAAWADRTDTIFEYKSWRVQGVSFDDGTYACLAEVSDPGDSFTIWILQDSSIRLQFYSEDWDFGEGDTADLEVEIDRRSPWSLTAADLYKQSVLFNLPASDSSSRFVLEVARGNRLHLRSSDGTPVQSYSLAGSSASISKLIDCADAITTDSNPFK